MKRSSRPSIPSPSGDAPTAIRASKPEARHSTANDRVRRPDRAWSWTRPPILRRRSFDELRLEGLSVILTDRCDFDCSYCYEERSGRSLDFPTFVRAMDLLHPLLGPGCVVGFYGGEPLLAFDMMKRAVGHLEERFADEPGRVRFAVTTNGNRLNDRVLEFLDAHEFSVALSFDGLAQDVTRKKGTFGLLSDLIPSILARPRIGLETNSVFTAETVGLLADSVEYLVGLGVQRLDVNFAPVPAWAASALRRLESEIERVGEFFLARFDRLEDIPWSDLGRPPERAIRRCTAGADRMALSARGELWGCPVFAHCRIGDPGTDPVREYCFGDVESFARDPARIYGERMDRCADLRMDRFSTPDRKCRDCDEVDVCWICPLAAALTSGEIGRIAAASCERNRIARAAVRRARDAFDRRHPSDPGEGRTKSG